MVQKAWLASVVLCAGLTGCGSVASHASAHISARAVASTVATSPLPVPVSTPTPTEPPCVFPATAADLVGRFGSEATPVEVTIPAVISVPKTTVASYETYSEYDFTPSDVLENFDNPTLGSFAIQTDIPLSVGQEYVLFIFTLPGSQSSSGLPVYAIADGYFGIFSISNGSVGMSCPNYADPAAPMTASGSGVPLGSFRVEIQQAIAASSTEVPQ